MLIRNAKTFNTGLVLAISFVGVLLLIFSPVFGGKNGLEYSDDLFNKLSKGSSYFISTVAEHNKKFVGTQLTVSVKLDKPETVEKAQKLLIAAGALVGAKDTELKINGDLGKILLAVLKDSDDMYKNEGSSLVSRYGFSETDVMTVWWNVLKLTVKPLQKDKKIEDANMIMEVLQKAVEPAFNYYKIPAESVASKAGTMTGLLVFYVMYTMWWGYAIFYMFDGLGLSMKKAKVKKEV